MALCISKIPTKAPSEQEQNGRSLLERGFCRGDQKICVVKVQPNWKILFSQMRITMHKESCATYRKYFWHFNHALFSVVWKAVHSCQCTSCVSIFFFLWFQIVSQGCLSPTKSKHLFWQELTGTVGKTLLLSYLFLAGFGNVCSLFNFEL